MRNKLLKMLLFIIGFLLAVLGLLWAISLSFQGHLAENSGKVAILIIIGIILLIIGWRED